MVDVAGATLRGARERHGISQARLARRAGTSQAAISQIERGVVSPSVTTLAGLLACLGEELVLTTTPAAGSQDDAAVVRAARRPTPREGLESALNFAEFAGELLGKGRK